jgi:DNA-binding NarL/FixJ family response regulator
LAHEAFSAGAKGCVLKSDAGNLLITAVEHLLQNKTFSAPDRESRVAGFLDPAFAPTGIGTG